MPEEGKGTARSVRRCPCKRSIQSGWQWAGFSLAPQPISCSYMDRFRRRVSGPFRRPVRSYPELPGCLLLASAPL